MSTKAKIITITSNPAVVTDLREKPRMPVTTALIPTGGNLNNEDFLELCPT